MGYNFMVNNPYIFPSSPPPSSSTPSRSPTRPPRTATTPSSTSSSRRRLRSPSTRGTRMIRGTTQRSRSHREREGKGLLLHYFSIVFAFIFFTSYVLHELLKIQYFPSCLSMLFLGVFKCSKVLNSNYGALSFSIYVIGCARGEDFVFTPVGQYLSEEPAALTDEAVRNSAIIASCVAQGFATLSLGQ